MSEKEVWRKQGQGKYCELVVPDPNRADISAKLYFSMPEWLADIILQNRALEQEFAVAFTHRIDPGYDLTEVVSKFKSLEAGEHAYFDLLQKAEARIAELEAENKTLVADLKWPIWVAELQAKLKAAEAEVASLRELVEELNG